MVLRRAEKDGIQPVKSLRMIASKLPPPLRRLLGRTYRAACIPHRSWSFHTGLKSYLKDPDLATQPDSPLLRKLVYGWGNEGHSALGEFLAASIDRALTSNGPILECGSGLSTLLVGAAAQRSGHRMWSLESSEIWGERVRAALSRYGIAGVSVCVEPLKSYGEFDWYNPPVDEFPSQFALILCDGPTAETRGGRYGLVPVMRKWISDDTVVLLDDAQRIEEQQIAERWSKELGWPAKVCGNHKPYIELKSSAASELRG